MSLRPVHNHALSLGIGCRPTADLRLTGPSALRLPADSAADLALLEFIYPRLLPCGALLGHDDGEHSFPGAKQALDALLGEQTERITPCRQTPGLLIKVAGPPPIQR